MNKFYQGDTVSLKAFPNEKFTVVKKGEKERCIVFKIKVLKTDNTTYFYKEDSLKLAI